MELKIALLAGDGIGPEVVAQAVKVCDAIANNLITTFNGCLLLQGLQL